MTGRRGFSLSLALITCLALTACATPHSDDRPATAAASQAAPLVVALNPATYRVYMEQQAARLKLMLAEEMARDAVAMEHLDDGGIRLIVAAAGLFGEAGALQESALVPLQKIAVMALDFDRTVLHVLGHLDAAADRQQQLEVSTRQAARVVAYLIQRGVAPYRLRSRGHGDAFPWVTNQTEAGRLMNRRIEIVLRPVVRGQGASAWESPPAVEYAL